MHNAALESHESPNEPAPLLTLAHLDQLPTLPAVAVRVIQLTSERNARVEDLLNLLRPDPAITSRVLAVANAAATGARGGVATLERAVVLLGFASVRNIVLAVKVFECFAGNASSARRGGFDRSEFWKHSIAVASAARRLATARKAAALDPEEAYVAGLLHDIGKVALDALFPKAYDRISAQADRTGADIADMERATLGADHTVAGRTLAERWRLPAHLRDVIWLHHLSPESLPASVSNRGLISLVQLADTLVREQHIGYSGNYVIYDSAAAVAARIGVEASQLESVTAALAPDVAEQVSLLGLDRDTTARVYLRSLTRANGELARANSDLISTNRRLAVAARYFKAASQFDERMQAWSDVPDVVRAIAQCASAALQRESVVALGLREQLGAVDLAWPLDGQGAASRTLEISDELRAALSECRSSKFVTRAPAALRMLAESAMPPAASQECWLLPLCQAGELFGAILYRSSGDEPLERSSESDELNAFLGRLGLSLANANALCAARRLSDDLAETNRRLQQVQAELLRSRTLSMIAEMASGAAHELNGPLTVISGRAQMLGVELNDPEAQRSLDLIVQKAHECSQIVSELMDFARPRPPQLSTLDLAELLIGVRDQQLARLNPGVRVRLLLPERREGPLALLADREQITLVMEELLKNAVEALRESGGEIVIQARRCTASPEAAPPQMAERFALGSSPTAAIEVVVRDPGRGMSPAVQHRAFDPFFSHRQAGRSRGLGLARAHRIIDSHGGRIWIDSRSGEGTAVHVILPERPSQPD